MTKIEYEPHCANCGALINEVLGYYEDETKVIGNSHLSNLHLKSIRITPYRCSNCGKIFEKIEIKLPRRMIG